MEEKFTNFNLAYYYGNLTKCNRAWCGYDYCLCYSKLYYILDGECEFLINGRKYVAKQGDLYLIPSGIKHSFYHISDNYIKKYWFHFEAEFNGEKLASIISDTYCISDCKDSEIKKHCRSILRCSEERTLGGELNLKLSLFSLLAFYISSVKAGDLSGKKCEIDNVVEYINKNIDRKISLFDLASLAHMHPNYFIRHFEKSLGISPMKYVTNAKIELAKFLLKDNSFTTETVMQRVGFDDPDHFYAFFKYHTGYSPAQYREIQ